MTDLLAYYTTIRDNAYKRLDQLKVDEPVNWQKTRAFRNIIETIVIAKDRIRQIEFERGKGKKK